MDQEEYSGDPVLQELQFSVNNLEDNHSVFGKESLKIKNIPSFVPLCDRYICNISDCFFNGMSVETLIKHLKDKHKGVLRFPCLHCSESTLIPLNKLEDHLLLHSGCLIKCELCQYFDYSLINVIEHFYTTHPKSNFNFKFIRFSGSSKLNSSYPKIFNLFSSSKDGRPENSVTSESSDEDIEIIYDQALNMVETEKNYNLCELEVGIHHEVPGNKICKQSSDDIEVEILFEVNPKHHSQPDECEIIEANTQGEDALVPGIETESITMIASHKRGEPDDLQQKCAETLEPSVSDTKYDIIRIHAQEYGQDAESSSNSVVKPVPQILYTKSKINEKDNVSETSDPEIKEVIDENEHEIHQDTGHTENPRKEFLVIEKSDYDDEVVFHSKIQKMKGKLSSRQKPNDISESKVLLSEIPEKKLRMSVIDDSALKCSDTDERVIDESINSSFESNENKENETQICRTYTSQEVLNAEQYHVNIKDMHNVFSAEKKMEEYRDSLSHDWRIYASTILEDLIRRFGSTGSPQKGMFCCPKCHKFKTNQEENMVDHLYKEMKYYRFVCTYCKRMTYSEAQMKGHHLRIHVRKGKIESYASLNQDADIELWVLYVISVQSDSLQKGKDDDGKTLDGSTNHAQHTSKEDLEEFCCQECGEKFLNEDLLDIHMKSLHFKSESWICGSCKFVSGCRKDVIQHAKETHKNVLNLCLKHCMLVKPSILDPVFWGKKFGLLDSLNAIESKKEQNIDHKHLYTCLSCPCISNSFLDAEAHWKIAHRSILSDESRKYKIWEVDEYIFKMNMDKEIVKYYCFYCMESYTDLLLLVKHISENHRICDLKIVFIRKKTYCCTECGYFSRTLPDVIDHFSVTHEDRIQMMEVHCDIFVNLKASKACAKLFFNKLKKKSQLPSTGISDRKVIAQEINYVCFWCQKRFDSRMFYIKHHAGYHSHLIPRYKRVEVLSEKNDGSSFSQVVLMPSNIPFRIKVDGVPYTCPICSTKTAIFQDLFHHLFQHVLPFNCQICGFAAASGILAHQHSKERHPEFPPFINQLRELDDVVSRILPLVDGVELSDHLLKDPSTSSSKIGSHKKPEISSGNSTMYPEIKDTTADFSHISVYYSVDGIEKQLMNLSQLSQLVNLNPVVVLKKLF